MVPRAGRSRIRQLASLAGQCDAGRAAGRRRADSGGVEVARRNAAELVAGGDVQLQEDLAQVVLNRAGADEQLCADLWVGETVSGQSSDVRLLGREHATCVVRTPPGSLSRGRELVTGALGEALDPDLAERLVGGSK